MGGAHAFRMRAKLERKKIFSISSRTVENGEIKVSFHECMYGSHALQVRAEVEKQKLFRMNSAVVKNVEMMICLVLELQFGYVMIFFPFLK